MALVQEQQFLVTASLPGTSPPKVLGTFDSWDGGDITSNSKTYRAGGMAEAEALPAPSETEEVTIGRGFRGERDGPLKRFLNSQVGQQIVLGKQPLNPDKTPVPDSLETYRGIIKGVQGPKHDSTGEDVSKLMIVVTVSGLPS